MELVCYLHPGWDPAIRPAEATRDWMDRTHDGFAYRCLPLNIANAHGWEVLSPCDFAATWRGGNELRDVVIMLPPDTPPALAPVSLFGFGVLTFHIFGIFRTPPGWNLWVGGSPNAAKDGLAPLTGIIETDWSPYTFTMNWRFTRPGHTVAFAKGEPICFIFPVERAAIERFQPRFAPMTEAVMAQFKAWQASRDAFRLAMQQNPNVAKADSWQKRYYRGLDMDDRQAVPDHRVRLRLPPFAAAGTPAAVAPEELHLRGDAATLGRVLRLTAEGLAQGMAVETLAAGLQELGLREADARAVIAACGAPPPPRFAPEPPIFD